MPVILYERQRQILDFIAQYIQKNGYAPSLKEIAIAMNLSSLATIHEHLTQLQKKGVIQITGKGKSRRMEIVDKKLSNQDAGMRLPILAFFSDGETLQAFTASQAFLSVAPSMLSGQKRAFILQVKNDSLKDEGVLDGDFLVLEEQTDIHNNDVVVCLMDDGKARLRRFFKETTRVRLESVKSFKEPIFVEKIRIQGKVIANIRKY